MPDPNKIEGGRWDRALRGLFNLKGAGSTSARISDDISPTFNFPWRLEDDFMVDERLMWGATRIGALAANFPRCNLTNVSTDQLVILEQVFIEDAGFNTFLQVEGGVIPAFTEQAKLPRDTRWGDGDVDLGIGVVNLMAGRAVAAHTQTNPILSFPPFQSNSITGDRYYPLNIVLAPGQHAVIFSVTSNEALEITWWWREHKTEPGELAGFQAT